MMSRFFPSCRIRGVVEFEAARWPAEFLVLFRSIRTFPERHVKADASYRTPETPLMQRLIEWALPRVFMIAKLHLGDPFSRWRSGPSAAPAVPLRCFKMRPEGRED